MLTSEDANLILLELKAEIAILTLNDTKTFNSLNRKLVNALTRILTQLSQDDKIRVIILKSAAKIFCSGANIREFQSMSFPERLRHDHFLSLKHVFQVISKPVIAVVNDGAFGGGFELALMCDFIVANKNAKFGFPEIKLGLIPGIAGTLIAKVIGRCFKKTCDKQTHFYRGQHFS